MTPGARGAIHSARERECQIVYSGQKKDKSKCVHVVRLSGFFVERCIHAIAELIASHKGRWQPGGDGGTLSPRNAQCSGRDVSNGEKFPTIW